MPTPPTLHPVTDAHRAAAFERLALRGWTLPAALQDPLRRRVIEALAHQIRTAEWKAQHAQRTRTVRRLQPASGRWCTQRVAGDWDDQQQTICTNDE